MSAMTSSPLSTSGHSLLPCRLSQPTQRRLIIKDCLVQSQPLRNKSGLGVGNFDNLRFAGAVTSDRSVNIGLREDHSLASQSYARGCGTCLRLSRIKLLSKAAYGNGAFVLCDLNTQTRLLFLASTSAPIEDWNIETDRGRHTRMFSETRSFKRIRIEAAIHRISERWQTFGTRDSYLLFGSAELCFQLNELRATRNVGSPKLLQPRINWYAQHEIGRGYSPCEIVADEHPQRASTNNLVGAPTF